MGFLADGLNVSVEGEINLDHGDDQLNNMSLDMNSNILQKPIETQKSKRSSDQIEKAKFSKVIIKITNYVL